LICRYLYKFTVKWSLVRTDGQWVYLLRVITDVKLSKYYTILQCCDLETKDSRLKSTRVHFTKVCVSRPCCQGVDHGLETLLETLLLVSRAEW